MTGWWVVLAALTTTLAFGWFRRSRDGVARALGGESVIRPEVLPGPLGSTATFVQFSSEFCAPCRSTARELERVIDTQPGVAHLELDAAAHPELLRQFGISRTPTVLLIDGAGVLRERFNGPSKPGTFGQSLAQLRTQTSNATPGR